MMSACVQAGVRTKSNDYYAILMKLHLTYEGRYGGMFFGKRILLPRGNQTWDKSVTSEFVIMRRFGKPGAMGSGM
jgi:hypothetical protein